MRRVPVGALMPDEADREAFDRKRRLEHLQAQGALAHQPLRYRRDQVGAADELGDEEEARRRYRDAALVPELAKRRIDRPAEAGAARRHHHMLERDELIERQFPFTQGCLSPAIVT